MKFRSNLCKITAGLCVALTLSGCASVIRPVRDAISPPGQMNADGTINPCHGYRTDFQACGNAIYNGARIGKVAIGQTVAEARAVMGRDPEKRGVRLQDGRSLEFWTFLIDYDKAITSRIEFVDGKVVGISQESA